MPIPFLDLRAAYLELKPEFDAAYERVMQSGRYILGAEVEAFEQEFAAFSSARHCVGVANGLDALRLALLAMDVKPGDEVIVPSNTYIATWLAVHDVGAVPVPVEPRLDTSNLDPARLEAAITPRTRVILPVHLYGQIADMELIAQVARRHGLRLLEDAAQSHGATLNGKPHGSWSDAATISFYPGKNLGAFGDAGAVITNDPAIADRVRTLGNYGSRVKYQHELKGVNSRLDPLQAAFLRVRLRHLPEWNARRKSIAGVYQRAFSDHPNLDIPAVPPGHDPSWHLYVIRVPERDSVQGQLEKQGIGTLIHYPVPPHRSGAFAHEFAGSSFPIAERLAAEVLSLPMGPHLSMEQAATVVEAVKAALYAPATLRSN